MVLNGSTAVFKVFLGKTVVFGVGITRTICSVMTLKFSVKTGLRECTLAQRARV